MYTCLVGQSRLFQAALTKLLEGTQFAVSAEVDSLSHIPTIEGALSAGGVLVLAQKPDRISEYSLVLESLKAQRAAPRIVLIARFLDAHEIAVSFASGVDGYLLEDISPAALIESLNLVMLGEKVFPSQLVALLAEPEWGSIKSGPPLSQFQHLSEREFEIIHWLAHGAPNKVIAGKMSITEATVKVHIKAILKKLGASNRTQAAIWAIQTGVLSPASEAVVRAAQ